MTKRPVYLLAGGHSSRRRDPDPLVQAVLKEAGRAAPVIAYIGTANGDDPGFFERMAAVFKAAGALTVNHARIAPDGADLDKARETIKSADIVFVSGGDVDLGMRILAEKGIAKFLADQYEGGKLFFGLSAGSIMLAHEWVRWPDPEDASSAELFPCLDFAAVICDSL